jgi:hypothetical protein
MTVVHLLVVLEGLVKATLGDGEKKAGLSEGHPVLFH